MSKAVTPTKEWAQGRDLTRDGVETLSSVPVRMPCYYNFNKWFGKKVRVCFTTADPVPGSRKVKSGRFYRTGILDRDEGCVDGCCYSCFVIFVPKP